MILAKWNESRLPKKPTLTFDTNCVISIGKDQDIDLLVKWEQDSRLEIFKTDVVDTELKNTSALSKSKTIKEDIGPAVTGHSRIGYSKIGGDNEKEFLDDILELLFPETKGQSPTKNQVRDAMHIITHKDHSRDYYITNDQDFIRKKKELAKYGVIVMTPKECVEKLTKS